jgi:hypothetical protein
VVAFAGVLVGRARIRRAHADLTGVEYYPRIDLNLESHRRVLMAIGAGVLVTIPFIGFMSYHGYEYTDSNEFCGEICHTVMQPQYTAHKSGAHARVECAACHIGRGASWYVRSKLSGLRQVVAVTLDTFPRPIPAAITELRPATQTCEQCHWPEKFYGDQLVTIERFAYDERSTPRGVRMLVRTGGSDPTIGRPSGIHWHMALQHSIEFVAVDDALQEIPWVRAVDHATGRETVYRSDGKPADAPPPAGVRRRMDCMDCHNRATHAFRPPAAAADLALRAKPELRQLPFAKRQLVTALTEPYATRREALAGVGTMLREFYANGNPAPPPEALLADLVAAAREIVRLNYFPAMRADWRSYPNNIGHKDYPGCFRCHAGDHVDGGGRTISRQCGTCHEFLEPADPDDPESLIRSGNFTHPVELEGVHADLPCHLCHSGGVPPEATCEGCHADTVALRAGKLDVGVEIAPEPMNDLLGCPQCHDLSKRLDAAAMESTCLGCHDAAAMGGRLASWKATAEKHLSAASAAATPEQREIIERLRRAGPLHNIDATVKILSRFGKAPATPLSGAPSPG